jgi:hypothetical protein
MTDKLPLTYSVLRTAETVNVNHFYTAQALSKISLGRHVPIVSYLRTQSSYKNTNKYQPLNTSLTYPSGLVKCSFTMMHRSVTD